MDLEDIKQWNKPDTNKFCMASLICIIFLKVVKKSGFQGLGVVGNNGEVIKVTNFQPWDNEVRESDI